MPSIPRVLHQGLAADKPVADATLNQGWFYYETDTGILAQSWNGAWIAVSAPETTNVVVKIDEHVVAAGGESSIVFAAIPQTFSKLQVEINGMSDTAASLTGTSYNGVLMKINNDTTGAHYVNLQHWMAEATGDGVGESAAASTGEPTGIGVVGDPRTAIPNMPGHSFLEIPDYASTIFGKVMWYRTAVSTATYDFASVHGFIFYTETVGITDLTFTIQAGKFVEGSRARLYGIH